MPLLQSRMAFFKPGKEEEEKFDLKIEIEPEGAGTAQILGIGSSLNDIIAGTKVSLKADANTGDRKSVV